ncbi:hypothetical protein ACWEQC_44390 [Streptomyces shenzhenensis]
MQAEPIGWCLKVAGRRQCRPLGGTSPLSMFEATEDEVLPPRCRRPH